VKLFELTIAEARRGLVQGDFTSAELTRAALERAQSLNERLGAYLSLDAERALEDAARADKILGKRPADDVVPPLTGIPLAVKDNLCTRGLRTTCASRLLDNFIPPYESTATTRLREAGYVLLGKTNMDEFAMGSSNENSGFGPVRNPWDLNRIPGGSSGGSAAAVAADMCLGAIGSDTGGSIRQPAAFCGVVGLKPTYGRVSRYGLVAFASSLDQVGPLTKTVEDSALLLETLAGHDPLDSTSADRPSLQYTKQLGREVKGLRLGIPKQYFIEGMDPEVEEAVRGAVRVLESMGMETVSIDLPHTEYAVATYYVLATSEASSNLARYDGVRYGVRQGESDLLDMYASTRSIGFGEEVKRRIMLGTYALSSGYYEAYYLKAQKVRTLIRRDFERAYQKVDVIACPTTPTPPFPLGDKMEDPLQMYLTDIFTISANLAGGPGLSLPCGLTAAGLPVGLQLMGRPFDEGTLFQVGYAYEQGTDWHRRRPEL